MAHKQKEGYSVYSFERNVLSVLIPFVVYY